VSSRGFEEALAGHVTPGAVVLCEGATLRRLLVGISAQRVPCAPEFLLSSFLRRAQIEERGNDLALFWHAWEQERSAPTWPGSITWTTSSLPALWTAIAAAFATPRSSCIRSARCAARPSWMRKEVRAGWKQ
jgi:hypothetical protein